RAEWSLWSYTPRASFSPDVVRPRLARIAFVQVRTATLAWGRPSESKDSGEYLVTQAATRPITDTESTDILADILGKARLQVLERGEGLNKDQVLQVLQLPDDRLEELLALAHEVRMRWCGPEVEVEGIISLKTGGCPEDCHFCSQSGLFASPVRSARLDIPSLVEAAKQT